MNKSKHKRSRQALSRIATMTAHAPKDLLAVNYKKVEEKVLATMADKDLERLAKAEEKRKHKAARNIK